MMIGTEVDKEIQDAFALSHSDLFLSTAPISIPRKHSSVRRRIDYRAGRALEVLGHAIEYLSDELVREGGSLNTQDGRVEALEILMSLNRQIYFECPAIPSLRERALCFLRNHLTSWMICEVSPSRTASAESPVCRLSQRSDGRSATSWRRN